MVKTKRLEVLYEKVLLKPISQQKKTDGGILLPDSISNDIGQYTVLAVGHDLKHSDLVIKVGETVLVKGENEGVEVTLDKQDYLVLDLKEVVAVVRED